jgi:hypothetical protein
VCVALTSRGIRIRKRAVFFGSSFCHTRPFPKAKLLTSPKVLTPFWPLASPCVIPDRIPSHVVSFLQDPVLVCVQGKRVLHFNPPELLLAFFGIVGAPACMSNFAIPSSHRTHSPLQFLPRTSGVLKPRT